jgi:hypothetical protein
MSRIIIFMLFLSPIGFYSQDLSSVLKKANKLHVEGNLEQARYYFSIASSLDSSDQYHLDIKIFQIDSSLLFQSQFKDEISKMIKADSCFFADNNKCALGWYGSASELSYHYVDYRIGQIIKENPDLKSKWMVLVTKRMKVLIPFDSIKSIKRADSSVFSTKFNVIEWPSIDSIKYLDTLSALIDSKNWPLAGHIVHIHALTYGFKPLFEKDVNRLYDLRMKHLNSQEKSFRLKAEQIENLESMNNVDVDKIKRILAKVNPYEIEDKKLEKHFIQLKRKYKVGK